LLNIVFSGIFLLLQMPSSCDQRKKIFA
jgi:hypothetical protein